jgi:hypothetical protein
MTNPSTRLIKSDGIILAINPLCVIEKKNTILLMDFPSRLAASIDTRSDREKVHYE